MAKSTLLAQTAFAPQAWPDEDAGLDESISFARDALLRRQNPDGHWVFELEADATIPSEYILLLHYLDRRNSELERRLAVYLRRRQSAQHGGWPLFHEGAFDISASVKAYFALKAVGDDPQAPHMRRAREAILAHGGAEKTNVFTRFQMALYGAVPWRAVPVMPVEIMALPRWFPFHLDKVSYWSRTVIVPMLALMALKPRARNPLGISVDELFHTPPHKVRNWHSNRAKSFWVHVFRGIDAVLRATEPMFPKALRQHSLDKAVSFVRERLNGEDGLGAIYPAMANSVMMFDALGYSPDHPDFDIAWRSVNKLIVEGRDEAYVQPCVSPIWDTSLTAHAMLESGEEGILAARRAARWLAARQITDVVGDWASRRPDTPPGGWAFQYANPHYPDTDDTAVVAMALHRTDAISYKSHIDRAAQWILGMQCRDGGWGAFDADNTHSYLNAIPFADHGALLDPSTADVTARCLGMLAQLDYPTDHPAIQAAVAYLRREQEPDGCWFGRWGTNYIYGTWSVLNALNAVGVPGDDPSMRRAVDWLLARQRADGGWGEDGASYEPGKPKGEGPISTPAQTAWAVLGLMAAGEVSHPSVARGIAWLMDNQTEDGLWQEDHYTAVGFPRVFYLRYHGYRAFFPLFALSRYRNLTQGRANRVAFGF
ncbi:MAG: squalene--hopene cyclase [Alphaproteobacteria bacterium]|nr:MAG: squalene--hopene cyclase [Alphaproteobacteria bacterium]